MKLIITPTLLLLLPLIAFIFTITEASTIEHNNTGSVLTIDPAKLSFKFAVSWPQGFCKINTCWHPPGKPLVLPKFFTIHGLWPKYNGQCTDSHQKYDFKLLHRIYGNLKTYWPNIKSSLRPEKFWGDEWKKHGITCDIFGVEEYFAAALDLYQRVQTGLNQLKDQPWKNTADSIRNLNAFQGKKPFVLCKEVGVGAGKKNYLEELRFCANGYKQLINCEPQSLQDQYCSEPFKYSGAFLESSLGMVDQEEFVGGVVA